jgi:hypothetical protein
MIKVLEDAIEKIRTLPAERQRLAAEVLERIAEADEGDYQLSDDERRLVRDGLDDLDAGHIVTDADMTAFWNRNRR